MYEERTDEEILRYSNKVDSIKKLLDDETIEDAIAIISFLFVQIAIGTGADKGFFLDVLEKMRLKISINYGMECKLKI